MFPRSLKALVQVPSRQRFDVIAEGLRVLIEHVTVLTDELELAAKAGCTRIVPALQAQSEEESAKVLILLDLVRAGCDVRAVEVHQSLFYGHLERCVYAEVSEMSPQDFAEVRAQVDGLRASHYLDGPSGADWILRNDLIDKRESNMYVDYVRHEDGARWVSPADSPSMGLSPYFFVQRLVMSMARLGLTDPAALRIVADRWKDQHIDDDTHWQVVARLNRDLVETLIDDGLADPSLTGEDVRRVIDHWTFPLSSLDLSSLPVNMKELRERRDRRSGELAG